MILINNEVVLSNKMELNNFVSLLQGEIYDEDSEKAINCIINYLYEVWDRDEKLMTMMHKKMSETLYPLVIVDIQETSDLTDIVIKVASTEEEVKVLKKDEIAFEEFCEKYFGRMKPLFYRLCDLD